jgi:FMN-dependent NADH-azoreductase
MANHPASYLIHIDICENDVPDISFENLKTNEKLMIKTKRDETRRSCWFRAIP